MSRFPTALVCGFALLFSGCSHMVESRAIQAFTASLEEKDLDRLREQSSPAFEEKALRNDPLEALQQLRIPQGKTKVVKVDDDEEEGVKRVIVEVGESKRKIVYRLAKDEQTGNWVVDDIFLNRKELAANKSISEQMNLLLSVREFLDSWNSESRDRVLATSTPELGQSLEQLTPEHLSSLTRWLVGEAAEQENVRPAVHLGEDTAEVRLAKLKGELLIAFRRVDGQWKADDLAVESRKNGESVASVKHLSSALATALSFQKAFTDSDKDTLKDVCSQRFFDLSLSAADLSVVTIPPLPVTPKEFEAKLEGNAAHFVIHTEKDVVQITLAEQPKDAPKDAPEYRVDEVTIYETDGTQDKRLSALFTSQAIMQIFADALTKRNLEGLRLSSTHDFNQRVWERLTPDTLATLPMPGIYAGKPKVLTTVFKGPITEITVEQGEGPVTYVVRDQSGRVLIDDILTPAYQRPESLKISFEVMIPVLNFVAALDESNVENLRANSSHDFCRIIWNHIETIPEIQLDIERLLSQPLSKIQVVHDRAIVQMGDDRLGAKLQLVKERNHYTVDDVLMISGPETEQRMAYKRALRIRLREGPPATMEHHYASP